MGKILTQKEGKKETQETTTGHQGQKVGYVEKRTKEKEHIKKRIAPHYS
jgi:hypothetical protein